MVREVIIRDGDGGGGINRVNEPVSASRHGNMVDPDIGRPKDRNPIAIAPRPEPVMPRGVPYKPSFTRLDIMDVNPVDDHVFHKLQRDSRAVRDVHFSAAAVYRFVTVHNELLSQTDDHILFEHDPQWFFLNNCMAQCSWSRVYDIIV